MSSRLKTMLGIIILLILLLVIFLTPLKSVIVRFGGMIISPVNNLINSVSTSISNWTYSVTHANKVMDENIKIKSENVELKNKIGLYQGLEAENNRLEALLDLKEKYSTINSTGAEIISRDAGNWFTVFTINKGTKDGINKNQPVLCSGGLVGHTTVVGPNWAKVVTLIDTTHSASGMSARSGHYVQVDGDISLMGGGLCKMTNISEDTDIIVGDVIVTSGIGGVYPKDIAIGTVLEFKESETGAGSYAIIKPSVDFRHINEVLVLKTNSEVSE